MVDRSSVLKLEEIDERAGVDGSVFYPFLTLVSMVSLKFLISASFLRDLEKTFLSFSEN